ncbi:MAG: SdrD B-like domain-containing protein [Chloroflexota bacterium]
MLRLGRPFALFVTGLVFVSGVMPVLPATAASDPRPPISSVTTLDAGEPGAAAAAAPDASPAPSPSVSPSPSPSADPTPPPPPAPTPARKKPTRHRTPKPAATEPPSPASSDAPTADPAGAATPLPGDSPSAAPAADPTPEPAEDPTPEPTPEPMPDATLAPSPVVTAEPTSPTDLPTDPSPSPAPPATPQPVASAEPSVEPTVDPSRAPLPRASAEPTPTAEPTPLPSPVLSPEPSAIPSPSAAPSPSTDPCPVTPVDASPAPQPSPLDAAPAPSAAALAADPCATAPSVRVAPLGTGSSITGFVWSDVNANGIYEPDPPAAGAHPDAPLGGVSVALYRDGDPVPVATAVSDPDGTYGFADVEDGSYHLVFTAPSGYLGTTSSVDSPAQADPPPIVPDQPATSQITGLVITGATQLDGNDAGIRPFPELGLAIARRPGGGDAIYDGTAPFDADDTPGHDSASDNQRVRTGDLTTFDFSITADNFAPGQTVLQDVVLEQVISPNDGAVIGFDGIPTACLTSGVDPVSVIEPAGPPEYPAGSWRLVCNIGPYEEGEVRIIDTEVKALGGSPEGSSFSSAQRVYQAQDQAVPATTTVPDIVITAAPRYDLTKGNGGDETSPPNPFNRQGIGDAYHYYTDPQGHRVVGREVWYDLSVLGANRGLGQAQLMDPLTFTDQLTLDAGSGPIDLAGAWIASCGPGPIGNALPGDGAGGPPQDDKVANAGQWTCDFDAATGRTDITIVGADTTGAHYPTKGLAGNSLSDLGFVATGHIRIIVPQEDWARSVDPGWQPGDPLPGGDITVTNCVADFAPVSVEGVPNFDGEGGDPPLNNCHQLVTSIGGSGGAGTQKAFGDVPAYLSGGQAVVDTSVQNASGSRTGDAPVANAQPVAGLVSFGTDTYDPVAGIVACDAFDNATLRLAPLFGGAAAQTPAAISTYANILEYDAPTDTWSVGTSTGWAVEFASAGAWGYDHLAGPRDPITGYYPLSSGWTVQRGAVDDCASSSLSWFPDPASVPGGIDAVNVIRIRALDQERGFRLGDRVLLGTAFDVRDTFQGGPNDGVVIPNGTKMPNFGLFQWDGHGQASSYDPNTATGDRGDRVIMSRAQISLEKTAPFATATAGDPITWTIHVTVLDGTVDAIASDVTVTDTLPVELTLDIDCTRRLLPAGISLASVAYDTPAAGQTTLVFDLGDRQGGVAVPDIKVCTESDPFALPNTDVVNRAVVAATNAPSPLSRRSDDATVRLLQKASFSIAKAVDRRVDLQDDDQVWTLRWSNFSTSLPFAGVDLIDVFPFPGDGLPGSGSPRTGVTSAFSGSLTLTRLMDPPVRETVAPRSELGTWYYATAADPATISYDPRVPANLDPAAPGGLWCTATEIGSGGACPATLADVRAVRFVEGEPVPAGVSVVAVLPLQALGNAPGDIYVNRFASSSSTTGQLLRSNQPYVQILGFSLGDLVFSDVNVNGRYDQGVDVGIPGVRVEVHRTDGSLVATAFTDTDGRWIVEHVAPGTKLGSTWSIQYRVVVPASNFAPGGPLAHTWPTVDPKPADDDLNEPDDHQARDLGDPATFGTSSDLVTLSADASGPIIVGEEPLGDNVAHLGNPLMGDGFTQLTVDMGVQPLPVLDMTKSIVSGPTPQADGTVRIQYRVRVTNTGPGAGTYDLSDTLRFGAGVDIVSATADTNSAWDGVGHTTLAVEAPIAPGATIDHTLTVVVRVDEATATNLSTDCALDGGETGTGLRNDATLDWTDGHTGDQTVDRTVCAPLPILAITKQIVGSPVVSGATTTITYDVRVTNRGGGAGTYDLDDQLRFGSGVTIGTRSVTNTTPGTITTNPAWNGTTTPRVVTGQTIAAQTGVTPTTQVFRVVAAASVDTNGATWDSSDCALTGGETGTGFRNDARLIAGPTTTVSDCAPFAALRITKTVVAGSPVANGDGTFTISYDVTVSNVGAGATTYDLADRLRFGAGVTIGTRSIANTTPGTIVTNPAWNGTTTTAVVTAQPIAGATSAAAPTTDVYRVVATASVDESTATFASSDCTLGGGETGTGFRNDGTVAFPGGGFTAPACVPFPIVKVTKTLTSSTIQSDGSFVVQYALRVTNTGAGAATYSLSDGFHFGTGVTIVPATTTITATPGTVVPSPTWDGVANQQIVTNQAIAAAPSASGTVHAFTIKTRVALDRATATTASTDCTLAGGETGTGARNDASMTSNGESSSANACAAFPILDVTKVLVGAPVENGDGTTTVSYDVTVSNRGGGAGTYTLDDQLRFGAGVTIGTRSVTNTTPGTITPNPAWDGIATTRVVTNQAIAAQTGVSPVLHVFRVVARVTIDGSATTATSSDCILQGGETGTGFRNDATMVQGTTTTVTDCAPFPAVAVTKTLVGSPVQNGDGTITVSYDVTVRSTGAVPTSYTLQDALRFGAGATVVGSSVSNTTPGSIVTNPAWNGTTTTAIVTNQAIAVGDTHVYRVVASATIQPGSTTPGSSDCTLQGGETGTGFLNAATLIVNGGSASATDCAPFPGLVVGKVVHEVRLGADGVHTVTYDLTVTNNGTGASTYALSDILGFGAGTTILAASVANTAPGTIVTNPAWNGRSVTSIVSGQAIAGAATHTYRVTVRVTVDAATATTASSDCTLQGGETGTGFRNSTSLTTNGETSGATDCAPFPILAITKSVTSGPTPVGAGRWSIGYAVTVANTGAGDARYDLSDTLHFGAGTTVTSAAVTTSSPGAGTPSPAWDGASHPTIVTGVLLGASASHVYQVAVTAAIDETTATPAGSDCDTTDSPETGFRNVAAVTWGDHRLRSGGSLPQVTEPVDGPGDSAEACAPFPLLSVSKVLDGDPVENGDGTWTVAYELTVTNAGAGAATYDLADTFAFGAGIGIVAGSAAVTNTSPGTITTDPAFDGVAHPAVVAGQSIGGADSHVYRVTVDVTVDASTATGASSDCTLDLGETGTGLRNAATLTSNGEAQDADACAPVPVVSVTKDLVSTDLATDGRYTLVYDVTVANVGAGATTYDLADTLRFGAGASIVPGSASVVNTVPGGIAVDPAWDGVSDLVIVQGEPIGARTTHVYRITVDATVDAGTATTGSSDCALTNGEPGTGFLNQAALIVNGVPDEAEACAPFAIPTLTKTTPSGPTQAGNGTWSISYDLTVDNAGSAPVTYDLSDTLRFGAGTTVQSASVSTASSGAGTPSATWDGASDTTIVRGVVLPAGTSHIYTVTVTASIDESTASADSSDCDTTDSPETGFRNVSGLAYQAGAVDTGGTPISGPELTAEACAPFPLLSITKSVAADSPTENGDGTMTVRYDVTVANAGAGATTYDLTDTLRFGAGVTIQDASVAGPAGITINAGWDGVTDPSVVTDQPIAGSTDHVYHVTVVLTVDVTTATNASSDCTLAVGETGTGLRNDAQLVTNDEALDADACAPFPIVTITKTVVGTPAYDGQGGAVIDYDVTVTNAGAGATTYDLVDALRFGVGATVTSASVSNTTPGTITTNPAWDGVTATTVVTDAPIAGATTHVYRVSVTATIDSSSATTDSSDCVLGQGETGTGWRNEATLTVNGVDAPADACAPFPILHVSKVVTEGPTGLGDGTQRIRYEVTVSNTGTSEGRYDLDDALRFGAGATVVSAAITDVTPSGVTPSATWDGVTDTRIVTDQAIDAGSSHVYTIEAIASVDPAVATLASSDCTLDRTESGTGFRNDATMTESGVGVDVEACVPFAVLTVTKTVVGDPVGDGLGGLTVAYDVTVTNSGAGGGVYDLTDQLRFGEGITVTSATVANTAPGQIATDPAWNGQDATTIVTGQPIDPSTSHVYRIDVAATVSIDTTIAQADCTLDQGETGTGLLNSAALTDNGVTTGADACVPAVRPDPVLRIEKVVSQPPTATATGVYETRYRITVTNDGRATMYDLTDTFRFGAGIEVRSTSARSIDPSGIPVRSDWNGDSQPLVATDVPIDVGEVHVYEATVVVAIIGTKRTAASADCGLDAGESGTGLLNTAGLVVEGGAQEVTDDACIAVTALPATDTLSSTDNGGPDLLALGGLLAAVLLSVAAWWVGWRPRRGVPGA